MSNQCALPNLLIHHLPEVELALRALDEENLMDFLTVRWDEIWNTLK
jgi:hypothetical protein